MFFMLGSAYALQRQQHIRTDFLYGKWTVRTRGLVDAACYIGLYFPALIFFLWVGAEFAYRSVLFNEKIVTSPWMPIILVACLVFLAWGALAPRPELDHARQVAAAVRERTPAGARVFIWGMHPEQYWLAGRTPASRYLTAGLLTNLSGGRDGPRVGEKYAVRGGWAAFHEEMRTRPPELVVDDSRGKPYAPDRVPSLEALLRARYEAVATVDGAVLYTPRDG